MNDARVNRWTKGAVTRAVFDVDPRTLRLQKSPVETDAEISPSGLFAVCRDPTRWDRPGMVIHARTGMCVQWCRTKKSAKQIVGAIEALDFNWNQGRFGGKVKPRKGAEPIGTLVRSAIGPEEFDAGRKQ